MVAISLGPGVNTDFLSLVVDRKHIDMVWYGLDILEKRIQRGVDVGEEESS
jgi:hypothetical protein